MIAIINYGLGNLSSILNMCKRLNIEAVITDNPDEIRNSSKLILPGVGHFKKGMENLQESGLRQILDEQVIENKKPILGICLGAQLMTISSEEGNVEGLGWVDGKTIMFQMDRLNGLKIPHMGWSEIEVENSNRLFADLPNEPRFYFVHSYHFVFSDKQQVTAVTKHSYEFVCAFQKENIYGTQFHPEKSHRFGMSLLDNFNRFA